MKVSDQQSKKHVSLVPTIYFIINQKFLLVSPFFNNFLSSSFDSSPLPTSSHLPSPPAPPGIYETAESLCRLYKKRNVDMC